MGLRLTVSAFSPATPLVDCLGGAGVNCRKSGVAKAQRQRRQSDEPLKLYRYDKSCKLKEGRDMCLAPRDGATSSIWCVEVESSLTKQQTMIWWDVFVRTRGQ
ncbi:hypothetical protein EJ04DRAFT_231183 [Polyplosphaeria fusca]|uniref:Uncharacterized protein n=1 Tax=Polyplosphaeria fusca TaxID=682080 RepID=A0A9P4R0P7_9PLEO|nr:hypothetical protein EJ04DRAFT_231183 [Polyplosphaeria fusca]